MADKKLAKIHKNKPFKFYVNSQIYEHHARYKIRIRKFIFIAQTKEQSRIRVKLRSLPFLFFVS